MKLRDYIQTRRFEVMQSRIRKTKDPAEQNLHAYLLGLEMTRVHQDRMYQQCDIQSGYLEQIADALKDAK